VAGHAGDTEIGLAWQLEIRQLGEVHGDSRGGEGLAPAGEGGHKVTGFETIITGGDHLADGAAVHGLPQLEGSGIALGVIHAPTHVRVDRHPEVADLHLARTGLG
jgi:hypothetical protein